MLKTRRNHLDDEGSMMDIRPKKIPERAKVVALRLVCQNCGHIIEAGEPNNRCCACGSTAVNLEKDPTKSVTLKCSA